MAQLVTWAITIVVIRLLSPEDYGLMALAYVFIEFLTMLNELGLGAAVVQRKKIDNKSLRSLFGLVLIVGILFYLILVVTAPLISSFYNEPRLIYLIRVLALQFLIIGFSVLPKSLLQREMKFKQRAIVDLTSAISGSIMTLVLALTGFGVWALVFGTLVIRVVAMVGFNIAHPFICIPHIDIKGAWPYLSFGGLVTVAMLVRHLFSQSDILIIGKMLDKDLLGYYAVGLMLATLPMEKVSGIIAQVAFPAFSAVQSEKEIISRYFLKAVRVMSFVAFPVLWGISSVAPEIVQVFLGEKWIQAILPLKIISLIIPLRMVSILMSNAVLGIGRADILLLTYIIPLIVMPSAFYIGSFWSVFGVSLAWTIGFPLAFFLNLCLVAKVLNISFYNILKAMQIPFFSAFIMYFGVFFIKEIPIMNTQIVFRMSILIAFGVLVYFIMTFFLNRRGLKEIIELVKA